MEAVKMSKNWTAQSFIKILQLPKRLRGPKLALLRTDKLLATLVAGWNAWIDL